MPYDPLGRTAPVWEERSGLLLPPGTRGVSGAGPAVALRPGFARLLAVLEVTEFGGGAGLAVRLQHSPDGLLWLDAAAFATAAGPGRQAVWLEAQPRLVGTVAPAGEGDLAAGEVHPGFLTARLRVRWELGGETAHAFGVTWTAIYER